MNKITILLIEKNDILRHLCMISLKALGYSVVAVNCGVVARQILSCRYQQANSMVIVADYQTIKTPETSFIQSIRDNPHFVNIPIMVFSYDEEIKSDVMREGADAFFTKPLVVKSLHDFINNIQFLSC